MAFQLRANHLTVSRILLLPIPCALLFYEGRVERLVALGLFTLLALTDWWDGKIARKQGPTVLGGLLDPIADKMFLAFTYLPLSCFEGVVGSGYKAVPVWFVCLMFLRELGVTSMRTISASYGIGFETAILAKYKTAFQMGGGGVLFWAIIWQDRFTVLVSGYGFLVAMILIVAIVRKIRRGSVGLKVWTQLCTYSACLLLAWFAPVQWLLWATAGSIMFLTLASGVYYARRTFSGMRERGWPASFGGVLVAVLESVSPVVVLSLLAVDEVPVWAPIVMLTAELAAGGLCDLLAKEKVRRNLWIAGLRSVALLAAGAAGWLGATVLAQPLLVAWAPVAAMAVAVAYCAALFITHRRVYYR